MSAMFWVEDTLGVLLKTIDGIDGDAGWLFVNCSLDLRNTILWHSDVRLNTDQFFGLDSMAFLGLVEVWIVLLKLNACFLSILEGIDLETAIAALVSLL
jgi:hypothetical protein